MNVSLSWVRQFTTIELTKEELIKRIGERLGAVEEWTDWGSYYDEKIIVARVKAASDHPDADRLGVYTIEIGGDTERTVVAGDKTLAVGDLVAYIPPGVAVPASIREGKPFVIEERSLRGVASQGMLGSGKELIFNDNHQHVQKLDNDVQIGSSLKDVYELDDVVISIENKMFTHRPDCFGILGVAREIAGIQGISFKTPEWYAVANDAVFPVPSEHLPVEVDNTIAELVPRFTAITLAGITVKPSPIMVQSYLMRVGLRPINNIVDITNFLMHLTAQPTHAFDYDKVVGAGNDPSRARLVVRMSRDDETLTLLDGKKLKMSEGHMLVCSDDVPISVGGSMGGADTEVDGNTKNIILEAANWDMYQIRRSSFELGIFTDAVSRFNKGQSPDQCLPVGAYGVELLAEHANGVVASNVVDVYPAPHATVPIEVDAKFINERLGSDFTPEQIAEVLNYTELDASVADNRIVVVSPFWRQDLHIGEDIVEEVGRLYGFDNLPMNLPVRQASPASASDELLFARRLRLILSSAGANEVMTYNFVSDALFEKSGQDSAQAYHIRNALAPDLQFMRASIQPSILSHVYANIRQGENAFALYEIGKAHDKQAIDSDGLPVEHRRISLTATIEDKRASSMQGAPYYMARRYAEHLLDSLGIDSYKVEYERVDDVDTEKMEWTWQHLSLLFDPQRSAIVYFDRQPIGIIGEYTNKASKGFKLPRYSAGFEFDAERLMGVTGTRSVYSQLSRFPATEQDVTFISSSEMSSATLQRAVEAAIAEDRLMVKVSIIDIFQRKGDSEHKNITLRISLQHMDQTLTTQDVNQKIEHMVESVSRHCNVQQV